MGWLWAARLNIKNVIPVNFSITGTLHFAPIKKEEGFEGLINPQGQCLLAQAHQNALLVAKKSTILSKC